MLNSTDISVSLPTAYKRNDLPSADSKTPTSQLPNIQEEIKPNLILSGVNKVKKKLIRGIVKHGAL